MSYSVFTALNKNRLESMEDTALWVQLRASELGGDEILIAAVCDGVGSLELSGEVSEFAAVETIGELARRITLYARAHGVSIINKLRDNIGQIISSINDGLIRNYPDERRIGTTLTFAVFWRGSLLACSVGDSPVYLIKDGSCKLLLELDNREGDKNEITQCLGERNRKLQPNVRIVDDFKTGDKVLIGSDGAFGGLNQCDIKDTVASLGASQKCADAIIDDAANTTRDNQALILVSVKER